MASTTPLTRSLAGVDIHPIGLGEMPMSLDGRPDEERSIRTIHAALDAGVGLIDTADAYARDDRDIGHGERLVAKALKGRRDDVIVATKGGLTRNREQRWPPDGRPEHLRAACEASLRALETDRIDLYQFHRPDPKVPYAESIGTFKELQDEGKVRWVGISNATVDQLEEALGIVDVVSVQNQLSLGYTGPIAKGEVQACTERGIAFLAWSPLGGISSAAEAADGVDPVRAAAEAHGVSPQQVALAWLLSLSADDDPDPRLEPPGDHHRFAARRRARAQRRGASGDLGGGRRRLAGAPDLARDHEQEREEGERAEDEGEVERAAAGAAGRGAADRQLGPLRLALRAAVLARGARVMLGQDGAALPGAAAGGTGVPVPGAAVTAVVVRAGVLARARAVEGAQPAQAAALERDDARAPQMGDARDLAARVRAQAPDAGAQAEHAAL